MKGKTIIQNIIVVTAWLLVGAAMIILLAAANRKQKNQLCKGVIVKIKGVNNRSYIDKEDILQQLQGEKNILTSKQITRINLAQLELKLEKGSWIKDADLYFDSKNVLHAIVLEREPVARVFTNSGASFYIDNKGTKMRLLDDTSLRLPVVTHFFAAKKLNRKDSSVVKELTSIIKFIKGDSFWNSQITQIDITPTRKFELIPLIGNHVIRIGNGEQLKEKFGRLKTYYKMVATKTGFDKYKVLDVQYRGQLLGIKKIKYSPIDSIQLQKNIEELMERTRLQAAQDSLTVIEYNNLSAINDTVLKQHAAENKPTVNPVKLFSNPLKAKSKPLKQRSTNKKEDLKPKAVMQRREG